MNENCVIYEILAKTNNIFIFNNIYLLISNNMLTHKFKGRPVFPEKP